MSGEKVFVPLLDIDKVLPILNKISILGGLTGEQLLKMFHRMESASYRQGETIFTKGDPATHLYVILSGCVRIVVDVDGTWMELVEYQAGQCFGETSVIGVLPHSASALVMEHAEVMALSAHNIHELYHEDPPLFGFLILNIAREACRRLHKTDQLLLHYARRHGT